MKRTTAALMALATLAMGLAALNLSPAACQTMVRDELVKARTYGPPVELELWVDKGEDAVYREGEEVRIRFRASRDCYVVIYDIDTEGFLTLLYPDYPGHDGFVEGGRIYRLPHVGARYELLAEGPAGVEYVAAIASAVPLAHRLPWYLSESYEASGYKGYDDLEATIYDVGAVRGDPYVAIRDIAYDVLPEDIAEPDYDTAYTFFNVGREYRHPRYLCYDCHGHVSWFDPYYDSCSLFEVRVDLDWRFVSHPTFYAVGPRFWYWNRYDGHHLYVGIPAFWCSVYPRPLFWDHYWDRLRIVGLRHDRGGNAYIPPKYRGKPGYWGGDRNYKPPPRDYRRGSGGGGAHFDEPAPGADGRKYGQRGKPASPVEVRRPERLAKLESVRLDSGGGAERGSREKPQVSPRQGATVRSREAGAAVKAEEKRSRSESRSRIKIVKKRDSGGEKAKGDAKNREKSRSESKTQSSKRSDDGGKAASSGSSARSRSGDTKKTDKASNNQAKPKKTRGSR